MEQRARHDGTFVFFCSLFFRFTFAFAFEPMTRTGRADIVPGWTLPAGFAHVHHRFTITEFCADVVASWRCYLVL